MRLRNLKSGLILATVQSTLNVIVHSGLYLDGIIVLTLFYDNYPTYFEKQKPFQMFIETYLRA